MDSSSKKIVTKPDKETYFIGHSVGCQAVLRYLETLDNNCKIGGAVFIAPWMHLDENTIKEEGEESLKIARSWTETPINWEKIKSHSDNFACVFSDTDIYVPLTNVQIFKDNLNAHIIIERNKGHFIESDNVRALPSAVNALSKFQ